MALDPRIAMGVQPPNIPQFDLLGAMLTSARLREASTIEEQRRQQMREAQAELVRQEQQRELFRQWRAEEEGRAPRQQVPSAPSFLQQQLADKPYAATVPGVRQTEFRPTVTSPITSEPGFAGTVRTGEDAVGVRTAEPVRLPGQPLPQTTLPVAAPGREVTPEERQTYEQAKRLTSKNPELEDALQRIQPTVTPPPAVPAGQPASAPLPSGAPQQGFLGPQDLGGGRTATVLNHTVTDERINGGKPTNIPLIVPGISQAEIKAIADGQRPSTEAYERSVAHAQNRIAGGEKLQSYNTIDEAVSAAKSESGERGQRLASTAQPPAAATAQVPSAAVTPLPGIPLRPRTATQRAYALLENGASNALQVVQGLDAAENAEVNRQTARLSQAVAGLDYIQRASGGVNSQATLDAVRADIESKAPGAGAILPQTYEPTQWTQFQNGLKTQEQLHREALVKIQEGQLKVAETGAQTQQRQADIHQQQVTQQGKTAEAGVASKAVDMAVDLFPLVNDQRSLDMYRGAVSAQSKEIAAMLPETYSKEAMDALDAKLKKMGVRAGSDEKAYGTVYFDKEGNSWQATTRARMVRSEFAQSMGTAPGTPPTTVQPPPGVTLTPQTPQQPQTPQTPAAATEQPKILPKYTTADAGTETVILGPGGRELGRISKNVKGKAFDEEVGKLLGKEQSERRATVAKVQENIAQIDEKQKLMLPRIELAIKQAKNKEGWLPAAGVYGAKLKGVYQPAANLAGTLLGLTSNVGIEEMGNLKAAGGTLTPVTDKDLLTLQSTLGSLQQEQEPEQLIKTLEGLRDFLAASQQRRKEAFEQYKAEVPNPLAAPVPSQLPGQQPQAPPAGTQTPQTTGRKQIGEAEIQQAIKDSQAPGRIPKTRQQIIDAVRKNPAYELLVQ